MSKFQKTTELSLNNEKKQPSKPINQKATRFSDLSPSFNGNSFKNQCLKINSNMFNHNLWVLFSLEGTLLQAHVCISFFTFDLPPIFLLRTSINLILVLLILGFNLCSWVTILYIYILFYTKKKLFKTWTGNQNAAQLSCLIKKDINPYGGMRQTLYTETNTRLVVKQRQQSKYYKL